MGLLFILDRMTGKPVFGVEERAVPKSDVPGEESWPTQPFPLKPPPLGAHEPDRGRDDDAHARGAQILRGVVRQAAASGPYTPFGMKTDARVPGHDGRRQLGRRLVRPGAGVHLRQHEQPGRHGHMVPSPAGVADAVSQ